MLLSRTIRYIRPLTATRNNVRSFSFIDRLHVHRCINNIKNDSLHKPTLPSVCNLQMRFKKTSSKKDEDSDDEDWNTEDFSLTRDSKVVKFKTPSLRMDLVLKYALGIARNKIEKIFYESRIRLNGKKILKKSIRVHVGDEIDVVKGFSPKNPAHILVSRVEVLNASVVQNEEDEEAIVVSARRFKTLLVENYESDPYKESTADTS